MRDGETHAFSTLGEANTLFDSLFPDRDRAEMLYHGHPVLIKPYQIYVSEQESQEVAACKCMFFLRWIYFSDFFDLISMDVEGVISNELIRNHIWVQFASRY